LPDDAVISRSWYVGLAVAVLSVACALAMAFALPSAGQQAAPKVPSMPSTVELPHEPIQPMQGARGLDPRKVELGKQLFADKRLSRGSQVACITCHRPDHGDADDVALTTGLHGRLTKVNTPTVRNSRFSVAQFWDGLAATLEDQVDHPLENPDEMGTNWSEVIARLQGDQTLARQVRVIYGTPLSPPVVRDAIASYERSLDSSNSRFDAFLRGRADALTDMEVAGYRLFKDYGCSACHQGIAVGGNMFQRMGLFGDFFRERNLPVTPADLGHFNVTGDLADLHAFKVPSLRNVSLTAPYFHDGSAATLEAAIAVMARYQLGRDMRPSDIDLIVAFLGALTDEPVVASR